MATRLLNSDRRQEQTTQQRLFVRLANQHKGDLRTAIRQAMKSGASAFESDGRSAITAAVNDERQRIRQRIEAVHRASFDTLGRRVLDAALEKSRAGAGHEFKIVSEDPTEAFDEALRAFVAEQTAQQVERVLDTTNSQLARIITEGTREGAGVDEIARRIRTSADNLSRVRSEVIARTEAHKAGQRAQDQAAKASGIARQKEWISSADGRTRTDKFDHLRPDGETVDIDGRFKETGEELEHPGDPAGSAANIVQCRCSVGYVVD